MGKEEKRKGEREREKKIEGGKENVVEDEEKSRGKTKKGRK